MIDRRWFAASFALVCVETLAATDADLLRCRAITDVAARLACYDALPVAPAGAAPSAAPTSPAPAAAPAAAPASPEARFGLPKTAERAAEPDVIESHIPGRFAGWGPGSRITLANGQVWEVTDGSRASYWLENPRVKVHRALFGSFMLEIVGQGHAPRVRRVK